MKNLTAVLILLTTVILTGCSGLKVQEYNREANTHIKTIGLIKPKAPEKLNIYYFNHPGMQFGLIGGLAAAAEFDAKTNSYNEALNGMDFDPAAYYLERLQYHFEQAGYKTEIIETAPMAKTGFRESFPEADADAFVDTYFTMVGYVAGSPSSMYKPTVRMPTRLVDKGTKTVLFSNLMTTGEAYSLKPEWIYIASDGSNEYKDFDSLIAGTPASLDGLKTAIDAVAKELVSSLQGSDGNDAG